MKFKVTVELEEGVKATSEYNITGESLLVDINNKKGNTLDSRLTNLAADAGAASMRKILGHFKEGGLVVQRIKNGMREVKSVRDVDEAKAWLADGEPVPQS